MNRQFLTFSASALLAAAALAPKDLRVQRSRISQHLQALAEFGKNPQGVVSRVAYSDADLQGRQYVTGLMRDAKLEVAIDAAGNIVGTRAGSDPSLKPLLVGSHIDSVPEGGNFDGDVGSLSAIEVAQVLAENHVTLRHPLQVMIFQNEVFFIIVRRPPRSTLFHYTPLAELVADHNAAG